MINPPNGKEAYFVHVLTYLESNPKRLKHVLDDPELEVASFMLWVATRIRNIELFQNVIESMFEALPAFNHRVLLLNKLYKTDCLTEESICSLIKSISYMVNGGEGTVYNHFMAAIDALVIHPKISQVDTVEAYCLSKTTKVLENPRTPTILIQQLYEEKAKRLTMDEERKICNHPATSMALIELLYSEKTKDVVLSRNDIKPVFINLLKNRGITDPNFGSLPSEWLVEVLESVEG